MVDNSKMPSEKIFSAVKSAKNIIIITHSRPDADCLGSALAMREYAVSLGKVADIANDSPLPKSYEFIENINNTYNVLTKKSYDLVISVDCATDTRYKYFYDYVKEARDVIWIDHHLGDKGYGSINWVMPDASSTCEMIYKLLKNEYLTQKVAYYLFLGLSTDSGHFMHNSTTPEVLEIAADLVRKGVNINEVCYNLYKNRSKEKTKLIAAAIENMRFYEDGKITLIPLTTELMSPLNITGNDTEGIIDYASAVSGTKVAVCISEEKPSLYKVSLRSRTENVAAVAEFFGGGGHKFASGCQISGYLEDVIQKLVRSIKDVLWTE